MNDDQGDREALRSAVALTLWNRDAEFEWDRDAADLPAPDYVAAADAIIEGPLADPAHRRALFAVMGLHVDEYPSWRCELLGGVRDWRCRRDPDGAYCQCPTVATEYRVEPIDWRIETTPADSRSQTDPVHRDEVIRHPSGAVERRISVEYPGQSEQVIG